jgi:hypothetical protein
VVPNLLLGILGLSATSEVWIRVVGVVVFNIGLGYWFAAKSEAWAFFQGAVYSRSFLLVAFIGFWLLGFVKPVLILFGVIDVAGAIWTQRTLKSEG